MSKQRLSIVLAVLAATLAIAAPAAQAAPPRPDDRSLARGAAVAMPDLVERVLANQARAGVPPDAVDRALARPRARDLGIVQRSRSAANGFDWGAAGIGASTVALLVVLAAMGFAAKRQFRTRSVSAS
jgi:hypothetical protein